MHILIYRIMKQSKLLKKSSLSSFSIILTKTRFQLWRTWIQIRVTAFGALHAPPHLKQNSSLSSSPASALSQPPNFEAPHCTLNLRMNKHKNLIFSLFTPKLNWKVSKFDQKFSEFLTHPVDSLGIRTIQRPSYELDSSQRKSPH